MVVPTSVTGGSAGGISSSPGDAWGVAREFRALRATQGPGACEGGQIQSRVQADGEGSAVCLALPGVPLLTLYQSLLRRGCPPFTKKKTGSGG